MLTDLAFDLIQKSSGFRRSLPQSLLSSLATLVRSMNCYYSNLIEGRDTHPVDIERALKNDYSKDAHQRDLQLESKAHIEVQKWMDEGGLNDGRTISAAGIHVHGRRDAARPAAYRILLSAEEEIRLSKLSPKSGSILEAVLYRGELPRGDAGTVVGTGERQARRIVSALADRGVLESDSPRSPLRLTFPAALGQRWMPGLVPEKLYRAITRSPLWMRCPNITTCKRHIKITCQSGFPKAFHELGSYFTGGRAEWHREDEGCRWRRLPLP